MQSSRKRFGLKHREGDLCWSLSESEGRKEKAECRTASEMTYIVSSGALNSTPTNYCRMTCIMLVVVAVVDLVRVCVTKTVKVQ